MRIRVLGCSGGIGRGLATTSFLVDDDVLIDAGTGVSELTLGQMQRIRHIFITHSHLDHIAAIPLLADTLFDDLVAEPIVVHAQHQTVAVVQKHIFNGAIWPDFTALPNKADAVIKLDHMEAGTSIEIEGRSIEMIVVNHSVPAVAYRVESNGHSFAFSGDTTTNDTFWQALNKHDGLDLLFIESAFANRDRDLAALASHYCPQLLAEDLAKLKHRPTVGISHLKPGNETMIMEECRQLMPDRELKQLETGDVFNI